jgi:hypothetical protein
MIYITVIVVSIVGNKVSPQKRQQLEQQLRDNLQSKAAELSELFESTNSHWGYEDPIYRFYHQSFKVFYLQEQTNQIVKLLQSLLPDAKLNEWFMQIVKEGTGNEFSMDDNSRWTTATRPIVEAFFHARFFLEMAYRHNNPPKDELPSGWAAFLYLYNLR